MSKNGSLGCLGALLIAFGILVFLRWVLVGGAALLALAVGLGAAYFTGAAGRWAAGLAGLLLLLAVPWLVLSTFGLALGMIGWAVGLTFKLAPLGLLALGAYLLVKALR